MSPGGPGVNTYMTRKKESRRRRDARVAQVMEWWAMGVSREAIAERLGVTPERVRQIVEQFGEEVMGPTDRNRP